MKKSFNLLGGLLLVPATANVGNICGFQDFSHIFHHNPDSNILHDAEPRTFVHHFYRYAREFFVSRL